MRLFRHSGNVLTSDNSPFGSITHNYIILMSTYYSIIFGTKLEFDAVEMKQEEMRLLDIRSREAGSDQMFFGYFAKKDKKKRAVAKKKRRGHK